MNCPSCGIEVVEQAGFCHQCGQRLDLAGQPLPVGDAAEGEPVAQDAEGWESPDEVATQPATTPAENFRETASARREGEDEPEEEIWQGGYSTRAMIGAWALSGLITIVLLLIWIKWVSSTYWIVMLVLMLLPWLYQLVVLKYRQWSVRYWLTDQRFVHQTGILRRVTNRIETIDMDDITFEQKFLERLVGVGTIRISSSDRTHPELVLRGIEKVKEVSEKIDDVRRSERRRRGLHIESI